MGGEDWARWVAALSERGLLGPGFHTVALTYIGSDLTGPIYRQGTIGAAKADLEQTALTLSKVGGHALTSVNGAAVTQASTAIPGIALYVSLLHAVLGDAMQDPARQSAAAVGPAHRQRPAGPRRRGPDPPRPLGAGRRRPGRRTDRWESATPDNIGELADTAWFSRRGPPAVRLRRAHYDYESYPSRHPLALTLTLDP